MKPKSAIVAAVEIGSATIKVLVGDCSSNGVALIGSGECVSSGVSKGDVVDFKAASDCTHRALAAAEQSADAHIDYVFLAQSGGHLNGFSSEAVINVQSANHRVNRRDIDTVCALATSKELSPDRIVVHNIRGSFRIDGRTLPGSPEDLTAQRVEVSYWIVHGLQNRIADNIHLLRGFNIPVHELVLSSLASGHIVTTPWDRQNGVLVIDIGAGTSDFVLYRNGCPTRTGVLPVGGCHLTNDLALGLHLTDGQAEKLKLRQGRALVSASAKGEHVWLVGDHSIGDRQVPLHKVQQITAARSAETFEVIKKKLGSIFSPETCAAGVVLTGGSSKLPAIAECAATIFGVPARLGEPPPSVSEAFRGPSTSTVLGVFHYLVPGKRRGR